MSIEQVTEDMYRALRNLPCRCLHNIPYESDKVKRVLEHECARCKSMREYEALMNPPQVAA